MAGSAEQGAARRGSLAAWAAGASMLLLALVAKPFVGEPVWVGSLAQTGALLIGVGLVAELVSRKRGAGAYRTALGLALGALLLLGWVNAAVGIIGSEDNDANRMYGLVFLVAAIGAAISRLKPGGMARTLAATASAQALVAAIALIGRLGAPFSGPVEILAINGFFIVLFMGSSVLFSNAARARS